MAGEPGADGLADGGGSSWTTTGRTVAGGDAVVAPRATRRLISEYVAIAPRPAPRRAGRLGALTDRERTVLPAVARGLANAEIAVEMHPSEATVKTHVSRLLAKLGLRSRAVILAYETGLVPRGHPDDATSAGQPRSTQLPGR